MAPPYEMPFSILCSDSLTSSETITLQYFYNNPLRFSSASTFGSWPRKRL
ncbi:hypothetical protein SAMN05444285_10316 [Draconibacterium orientale]|jgi:hypothetical protein|uniref:Uncharacterized protein n=1 Tax=Draconibacterium orientale TaxID=1168034 RepID=A0A1I0A1Q6_9BACT|nr:hypothetical protein SAMN05444285_10316 [Draconibacterium orientale]